MAGKNEKNGQRRLLTSIWRHFVSFWRHFDVFIKICIKSEQNTLQTSLTPRWKAIELYFQEIQKYRPYLVLPKFADGAKVTSSEKWRYGVRMTSERQNVTKIVTQHFNNDINYLWKDEYIWIIFTDFIAKTIFYRICIEFYRFPGNFWKRSRQMCHHFVNFCPFSLIFSGKSHLSKILKVKKNGVKKLNSSSWIIKKPDGTANLPDPPPRLGLRCSYWLF